MLTERQKAFVDAYAGPGTGLAAARAAGYAGSDATLKVAASRLLRVPAVMAALEDRVTTSPTAPSATPLAKGRTRTPRTDTRIAGAAEQQRILTSIARDADVGSEVRIKAIVALARIQTPSSRPALPVAGAAPGTTVRAVFQVTHDAIDATPAETTDG